MNLKTCAKGTKLRVYTIVRENPERGGALHSLRRSIPCSFNTQNGIKLVQILYSASVEKIILGGRDAITGVILNGILGAIFKRSRRRPRCHFQEFQTAFQAPFSGIPDAASSISSNVKNIPVLNGTNFKKWKEHVIIVLGCMDLDYELREDRPLDLTDASIAKQRSIIEKWERSNLMSLMIMKHSIPEAIKGAIPKETRAKAFLDQTANRFAANKKVETSTILSKLVSIRYKGKKNIREYIMEMSNLVTRLKTLKLEFSEDILVHLVLISLPTQFSPFKISYNTQKEKWTLNELIAQCVQEEERLKQEKIESAHLASTSQGFGANKKRKMDNKGKQTAVSETSKQKVQKKQDKEITCFFCKKAGHMKKTCTKYAAWREKKGTLLNFVCSEINLAVVPTDTWWIDMGATTHISVTMRGCLRSRMPTDGERYIYVGNGNKVAVKAIGLFRLQLDFGCTLDLEETFVVQSFRRNLISVSCLDKFGYCCSFRNGMIQRLVSEGILDPLDFSDFQVCIECIKGEQRPGPPFAKYLMECGIVPQYTMSGTPRQNGVAERRNYTLKDMGCPTEARPYKPNEKKLDSRTVSCYFVGYSERSRGFKFYDPSSRSFFETGNAKFIEDVELSGRKQLRKVVFEKESVSIPTTGHGHIMFDDTIQNVQLITEIQDTPEISPTQVMEPIQVHEEVTQQPQQPQQPQVQVPLRRSTREKRSTILDDYVVYLQEHEFDMGLEDNPISVSQVKQSSNSEKWIEAMKEEMKSMKDNVVWDLVELPKGVKPIGCKWIFKTKRDSKGNIVRYKARLVAKGFTQKEGIDYKETFSPVSSNDSFRIIIALVAHYDLELHQMDVKIAFLNGNIDETIYMVQPENFESNDSKQLVCRLKRSIYGLKQASRQWYKKFDHVITSFGFKENTVDQCIYLKFSGSKFIILVLYVDDILLASSDVELLHETKRFLSSKFDMKDLGDASFVLGIQIYRDRPRGILGLSQKAYINKVLSRFGMSNCAPGDTPVAKGDKFSLHQCPKNELEKKDMERFLYASAIGSLMYAQVCTRSNIAYIVGMLGRYLSNPGCLDSRRSTSGYIFMFVGGAVSWKSVKQTLIASSTMEAEFIACYEASNLGIWL
ncbi:Retrovirus-related Pol polyprotein from transposon TNT 1-94 [Vitis vinifera]|uniref:Retrovirus-related Pol polyprotein from transposon TNT 1-94 n=1 Tax=Vitis vinifera TaxID=29760 RepID=A0A438BRQ0_VITVI|nr:Retrovirus-related Pol polyprotein from transposon TNT 1-94 [Vitis vinifera]